jgi:hypothetical protein
MWQQSGAHKLPNANTPQRQKPFASSDFGQGAREILTAVISVSIVGLALYMMFDTYRAAAKAAQLQQEFFSDQKDILRLALGFLGTVIGYYFGRVPAERHANTARDAAAKATESESRIKQLVRAGLDSIEQQRNAAGGGAAGDAVIQEINRLRATLS